MILTFNTYGTNELFQKYINFFVSLVLLLHFMLNLPLTFSSLFQPVASELAFVLGNTHSWNLWKFFKTVLLWIPKHSFLKGYGRSKVHNSNRKDQLKTKEYWLYSFGALKQLFEFESEIWRMCFKYT